MSYQKNITKTLAEFGRNDVDPRHVEAYMRLGHSTLNSLSRDQFTSEVDLAIACIDDGGPEMAEDCAKTFAL